MSTFACGIAADVDEDQQANVESVSIRHWYNKSAEEAAKKPKVKITGMVSSVGYGIIARDDVYPARTSLVVEDHSGGIWLRCWTAIREGLIDPDDEVWSQIRLGTMIEIEGFLDQGIVAPVVLPCKIKVIGQGQLPPAKNADLNRFLNGGYGMQRVAVSGVVQGMVKEVRPNWPHDNWILRVETGVGHFITRLPNESQYSVQRMLDAEVRVAGVAASLQNSHSQFLYPRVIIDQHDDFRVIREAAEDPFDLPITPLDGLDGFSPDGRQLHRVCVQGTVTYLRFPSMYVQEGDSAVRVQLNPVFDPDFAVGDRVQVSGFIDTETYTRGLRAAIARHIAGSADPIVPIEGNFEQILGTTQESRAWSRRSTKNYENRLIKLRGTLQEVYPGNASVPHHLVLDVGSGSVSAFLDSEFPKLELGTELELTGVADVSYGSIGTSAILSDPVRVDLLLRGFSDIVVLKYPAWWNSRRIATVLLFTLLAFGLTTVWVISLRKRVRSQAKQIAIQMRDRRDVAIEYDAALRERNRLAVNLHDTVLQTMVGIGYQIDACARASKSNGSVAERYLSTARRMADRGQEDLRNTVWTLHNVPVAGESLADAIEQLLMRFESQTDANFVVSCAEDLPKLADFVAGELLLVIQEAIRNSIKHGSPSEIVLELAFDSAKQAVTALIVDDGVGFDANKVKSVKEGHFGIDGMLQRVDRLNGRLVLESSPGRGTKISIRVPIENFDRELE